MVELSFKCKSDAKAHSRNETHLRPVGCEASADGCGGRVWAGGFVVFCSWALLLPAHMQVLLFRFFPTHRHGKLGFWRNFHNLLTCIDFKFSVRGPAGPFSPQTNRGARNCYSDSSEYSLGEWKRESHCRMELRSWGGNNRNSSRVNKWYSTWDGDRC